MDKVLIFGASGHAQVVASIIKAQGRYSILGFVDPALKRGSVIRGFPVVGSDDEIEQLASQANRGIIGIGDNFIRGKVAKSIKEKVKNFEFVKAVHPSAVIDESVTIAGGTVVMAGAVINCGSAIGAHCIVNTRSSIDHDCNIGDFATVSPGATLGGNVSIKNFAVIGLGANVLQQRTVGEHSVVGAGSVVLRNIDSFATAYGVPAKIGAERSAGDPYL